MRYCVDFDDLTDSTATPGLEVLSEIKLACPDFKVTLFAIPQRLTDSTIAKVKEVGAGWIQLAPHGWRHTRGECLSWNDEEARSKIELAAARGIDAPVFRAPAWLLDAHTYEACRQLKYVVASHCQFRVPNTNVPEYIYNYSTNGWIGVHGHLTPVANNFILKMRDEGKLTFARNATFAYPQDLAEVF